MDSALGGRLGLSHLENLAAVCSTLGGGRKGEKGCSGEGSWGLRAQKAKGYQEGLEAPEA